MRINNYASELSLKFLLGLVLTVLGGCESSGYYWQAANGQLDLLSSRQPIDEMLEDSETNDELRQQLELVKEIRRFAVTDLLLPDNGSYADYVQLDGRYVLWNVFAAQEFSTDARQWCYPVVGCMSYRGYFDEGAAQAYAAKIRAQGFDAYVGGVGAYSTLGWFDDPLLSSFLNRGEAGLAGLLFHELAHQQVYVNGDTVFNESFAHALEVEGVRLWFDRDGRTQEYQRYREYKKRGDDFVRCLLELRAGLDALYREDFPEQVMRQKKRAFIERFKAVTYQDFKRRWENYDGYDAWLADDFNNAKLVTVASYNEYLPAFSLLLAKQQGDLAGFYQRVQDLAELDSTQRREILLKEQATAGASVAASDLDAVRK